MLGDAKRFHELTENFTDWLEETERSHANNDAIGTPVERIQEQLNEQQVRNSRRNMVWHGGVVGGGRTDAVGMPVLVLLLSR